MSIDPHDVEDYKLRSIDIAVGLSTRNQNQHDKIGFKKSEIQCSLFPVIIDKLALQMNISVQAYQYSGYIQANQLACYFCAICYS